MLALIGTLVTLSFLPFLNQSVSEMTKKDHNGHCPDTLHRIKWSKWINILNSLSLCHILIFCIICSVYCCLLTLNNIFFLNLLLLLCCFLGRQSNLLNTSFNRTFDISESSSPLVVILPACKSELFMIPSKWITHIEPVCLPKYWRVPLDLSSVYDFTLIGHLAHSEVCSALNSGRRTLFSS